MAHWKKCDFGARKTWNEIWILKLPSTYITSLHLNSIDKQIMNTAVMLWKRHEGNERNDVHKT